MSAYKPPPGAYHSVYHPGGPSYLNASAQHAAPAHGQPSSSASHPASPPSRHDSRAHSPFQLDTTSGLLSPVHTGGASSRGHGHGHGGTRAYEDERAGARGRKMGDEYGAERWDARGQGQAQGQAGYSGQQQGYERNQGQYQNERSGYRGGYGESSHQGYGSQGFHPDGGPAYSHPQQNQNQTQNHEQQQQQHQNQQYAQQSSQHPFASHGQHPMTASSSSSSVGGFFSPNAPASGGRALMGPPSSGGHGPFGSYPAASGEDTRGHAYGADETRASGSGGSGFSGAGNGNAVGLAGVGGQGGASGSAYGYDSGVDSSGMSGSASGQARSSGYSYAGGAPRGALGMRGIPPRGPANSLSSLGLSGAGGERGYPVNGTGVPSSSSGQLWDPQADDTRSNASDRGSRGPRHDERGSRHSGRRDGRDARDRDRDRERERDRDRDRDRERDRDRDREKERDDEISTIFVVGFPEDMTEREFQNMFTFASGFEAAMLKVPQLAAVAAQDRKDRETALAVSLSLENLSNIPVALQQQVASRHTNPVNMLAELHTLQEQFARSSTANSDESSNPAPTEEVAAALTSQLQQVPSASSDGRSRGPSRDPPPPARRQTIGFARFRTRADALVARDLLQGRKIDIFPGSVLKAEMAKKNLHTKRPVPGEDVMSLLVRSGRLSGLLAGMNLGAAGLALASSNASIAGMTSGTSTPSGQALSTAVMPSSSPAPLPSRNRPSVATTADAGSQRGHDRGQIATAGGQVSVAAEPKSAARTTSSTYPAQYQQPTENHEEDGDRTISQDDAGRRASTTSRPPPMQHRRSDDLPWSPLPPPSEHEARRFEQMMPARQTDSGYGSAYASNNSAASPEMSTTSPPEKPKDSKALLALAEEEDELEGWRVGHMGMDQLGHFDGESRIGTPNHQQQAPAAQPEALTLYRSQRGSVSESYSVSPHDEPAGMADASSAGLSRLSYGMGAAMLPPIKPADQNPPINTLYVGNLPATPSATHPPNMLEDALRHLFGQCSGFKRLSYRQKLTPQCFVEFIDVASATRAMRELYGHTLNGLVRGGIRIAYSRNPLGQRGGGQFSPPSRNVNMPPQFTAAMGAIGPYQQIPLSPTSNTGALPFSLQYQPGSAASTYRRQSESTPLSPQAPPFSLPGSHSTSSATSPRFAASNGLHSPREHPVATSPLLPTSTPWGSGPTSGPSFSAFDAPHLRSG